MTTGNPYTWGFLVGTEPQVKKQSPMFMPPIAASKQHRGKTVLQIWAVARLVYLRPCGDIHKIFPGGDDILAWVATHLRRKQKANTTGKSAREHEQVPHIRDAIA